MKPEYWAILTAVFWATGSFFEKNGVKLGGLAPEMGITLRTSMALVVLCFLSYPFWGQIKTAGPKSLLMVAIGGGILAGSCGMLFFYKSIKTGNLATVMPLAFCLTPVIGAILGVIILKEKLSFAQIIGISFTILGASMTAYFKVK